MSIAPKTLSSLPLELELKPTANRKHVISVIRQRSSRKNYIWLRQVVRSLILRDHATWQHCQRVLRYTSILAESLGLSEETLELINIAALLHDVGKIAVGDGILMKPARLDESEFQSIRQHPIVGEQLIRSIFPDATILQGIRSHHERMDGMGYPDRLPGLEIPLVARIIAVADTFDALTSNRPYRPRPRSFAEACIILERETQGQLDPELVQRFSQVLRDEPIQFTYRPAMREADVLKAIRKPTIHRGDSLPLELL